MSSKALRFLIFCFLFSFGGCASSSKASQVLNQVKQEELILQEKSEVSSEGTPIEPLQVTIDSVPEIQTPVQGVSVWMEGIGTDAFLALGFLQELEKKFKIQSIHGVGFSCWVAMSWASENRGNYAEWQSFKWDSWNLLGTNVLSRVMGRSNLSGFQSRLENKLPLKNKDKFKISENCPYFKQGSFAFEDSRDLSLAEEIWIQMKNPFYFSKEDLSKDERQSGLMRISVMPNELLRFTPSSARYEDHLWIVLTNEVVRQELHRVPQVEIQRGVIDGLRWIRKSLASGQITLKDVKDLKKKRSMLLIGRKEGRSFFENPLVKQFVGMESEK